MLEEYSVSNPVTSSLLLKVDMHLDAGFNSLNVSTTLCMGLSTYVDPYWLPSIGTH